MSIQLALDELCPSCGDWVTFLSFDYDSGWCYECSQTQLDPTCALCGNVLTLHDAHRNTCRQCRQEHWYELHGDELEFLIVVKGYTKSQARQILLKLLRPICNYCGKPIKGAKGDSALFCRTKKPCHRAYLSYKSLIKKGGLTNQEALAIVKGQR